MNGYGNVLKDVALITVCCFFLTSCEAVIPERFATVKEAFPPNSLLQSPSDLPPDTTVRAAFAAPFADVFRAVMVGTTQAQFNIEQEDKNKGIILATRVFTAPSPAGLKGDLPSSKHRYYYGIVIKETGPKSSEVQVVAKRQLQCKKAGFAMYLTATFLIIVVVGLFLLPSLWEDNAKCDEFAQVQLATGIHNSEQEMAQLINFTRNNLIAAGAL